MTAAKRNGKPAREKPQQIADELRSLIVAGELSEGDSLGHEPDLVERFGVSRPSLARRFGSSRRRGSSRWSVASAAASSCTSRTSG